MIIFENNDFVYKRIFRCRITSIKIYDTFENYLEIETLKEGTSIYYKYYKKEDELKYKIIAIRLKVCK